MSFVQFDALIIGCGVAGLSTAIKLAESGLTIGILTRASDPHESNTYYAQGGITYPKFNREKYIQDSLRASSYTSSKYITSLVAQEGPEVIEEILLDKAATSFERSHDGNLKFTKEAAHSHSRILYKGDYTGREIEVSLLNYLNDVTRFPNVKIFTSNTAIDLITPIHQGAKIEHRYGPNIVVGAYTFNQKTDEVIKIISKVTILATGGIGALYLHHSNSEGARGDGLAMAKRAGAIITDMEFIQFHPTTYFDRSSNRRFLISEALRGEGGQLFNYQGQRFMTKYHPDAELAPRDVVARAIHEEMILSKHECVYLDISHKDSLWIKERFPTIYQHCLRNKLDITQSPIPVVPAAHYTCGGVKVNEWGQTSLDNLWAVGEVACTGLHGANRLASNSLLEGLYFGHRVAAKIIENIHDIHYFPDSQIKDWDLVFKECNLALVAQDYLTLRHTMWNYLGLIRDNERLNRAKAMILEMSEEIQRFYRHATLHDELIGLRNGVEVAQLVLSASLRNKDSVGCFFRKD